MLYYITLRLFLLCSAANVQKTSGSTSAVSVPVKSLAGEIIALKQKDHIDLSAEQGGGPSVCACFLMYCKCRAVT
jgi:hypothetical protein